MSLTPGLKWLIAACLGIPLVLVCLGAWISHRALVATGDTAQWVAHTYDVREKLRELLSDLQDVETGERGFLLSQQSQFLEPYLAAEPQIAGRLARLRELVAGKPAQLERLSRLEELVRDKLGHVQRTVALQRAGQRDAALTLANGGYGHEMMDAIRRQMTVLNAEEDRLLAVRRDAFASQLSSDRDLAFGLVAFQVLLIGVVGILLARVSRLQGLVTVCAWSKTIQLGGEWVSYDEYLRRRFGLQVTHGVNPTEAKRLLDEFHARTASASRPPGGPGTAAG